MPIIPLRLGAIDSPTKSDLIEIEAAMLYPDAQDENLRIQALASARSQGIIDTIRHGEGPFEIDDRAALADLLQAMLDADPLATVRERAAMRHADGHAIGKMVVQLLLTDDGREITITKAKAQLGETLARFGKGGRSDKINDERWRRYRPVAHLWGAVTYLRTKNPDWPFPADYRNLADFLALAEFLLILGAARVAEGKAPSGFAANTMLDRTMAWHPAPEIISALPGRYEFTAD
jgi:hypothetical protein